MISLAYTGSVRLKFVKLNLAEMRGHRKQPCASREETKAMNRMQHPWDAYTGPNLAYIQAQYERYAADPEAVEPSYRELFDRWGAPPSRRDDAGQEATAAAQPGGGELRLLEKAAAAVRLVWNIRTYGHLAADIDPLDLSPAADTRLLEPATFGLSASDLEAVPARLVWEHAPGDIANAKEAVERLRHAYTRTTAYEFAHVHEEKEREWLNRRVESELSGGEPLPAEERKMLLNRLVETAQFEAFLHRTFVGQKRFSIEGTDALVPMLDETVHRIAKAGGSHLLIGMAHRGRLNVLAHVLGKPYRIIFSEFHHAPNKDLVPSEGSTGLNYGWTGDVKYHLGADRSVEEEEGRTIRVVLANNPSHLEFVNPVVEGYARAAQENRSRPGYPAQDYGQAAAVLIHGDAAFAGEGIVAETLNFNRLRGYSNGGTIHIIVNNRLGFTTDSQDGRSTHYASDLAKGYEIPVVHVNADDPEACVRAVRLACEYRALFRKDFLIDLVGYRRYGHNESDDPETTQPIMYGKLRNHPPVSELYARRLIREGVVSEQDAERMKREALAKLQAAYEEMRRGEQAKAGGAQGAASMPAKSAPPEPVTAVPLVRLRAINAALLKRPEGFHMLPKLQRILERRAGALDEGGKADWALAETLAFATILEDGKPIRISGQDTQRGTFAHRHLILHDAATGETFCPLHALPQAKASFAIHNSPLSEGAVLGFEYGYNVYAPETLTIWEAQYGDFANAAQVIIDQFLSAGRSKWRQKSSLTLLLPHGYEGQGPEHSSARLERFLQLSGENNWTVVNLTRAAQYFHLLRRQAALSESDEARPLIVMAPKSLIRHPRVASPASEFAEGKFMPILEPSGPGGRPERVTRLLMCSGKVAIDLEEAMEAEGAARFDWLHVVRVERLYPFPEDELAAVVRRYGNVRELMWLQEEPRNMGAWSFVQPYLRHLAPERAEVLYAGRPERASTASGYQNVHAREQKLLLEQALAQGKTE